MDNKKQPEKQKALDSATGTELKRQFGKGSIWNWGKGHSGHHGKLDRSLVWTLRLGIGVWPMGRIIEFTDGPEIFGKTTLTLHWSQSSRKTAAFVLWDAEPRLAPIREATGRRY